VWLASDDYIQQSFQNFLCSTLPQDIVIAASFGFCQIAAIIEKE
jgi:hypothetical protein